MHEFKNQTIAVNGVKVIVVTEHLGNPSGVPAVRLRAIVGGTVMECSHTLCPVDGSCCPPEDGQVQVSLDAARLRLARQAASREALAQQLGQVS